MPGPSGNVRDIGDFDFRSFIMDIPPVTRTIFIAMFSCTLLSGLQVLPPALFLLEWTEVFRKFQIWRMFFTFCHLGRLGLTFLIRMYFLFTYSKQLEIGTFFGRPANYAWFLALVSTFVLAMTALIPSYVNGGALLIAIIHLWGRHAVNLTVTMYGFIQIPAKYLSLAMLCLDIIINGGISSADAFGLLGGHLYYFLDSVYPFMRGGKRLIFVPIWFERFIDQVQAFLASVTGLRSGPPPPSNYGRGPSGRSSTGFQSRTSNPSGRTAGDATASGWRSGFTAPSLRTGHNWGSGHALGST